jgi:hypothetical protein
LRKALARLGPTPGTSAMLVVSVMGTVRAGTRQSLTALRASLAAGRLWLCHQPLAIIPCTASDFLPS